MIEETGRDFVIHEGSSRDRYARVLSRSSDQRERDDRTASPRSALGPTDRAYSRDRRRDCRCRPVDGRVCVESQREGDASLLGRIEVGDLPAKRRIAGQSLAGPSRRSRA